jgi:aminoglycoside phosphotransferase (APT) family kinase protein
VSAAQNPDSPALHRRELEITAAMPPGAPAPHVIGSFDDGEWVALVLEDIEGHVPDLPWTRSQVDTVLAAAASLADMMTPSPVPDLRRAADELAEALSGWHNIRDSPPAELDPWAREHLDLLCELAEAGAHSLDGTTLCHSDMRADNVLLRPDGSVVFVDWPWASLGPAWLDTVMLLVNVRLYGGHDVEALLRVRCDAPSAAVDGVLAGLCGFFTDAARRPAPPGLPSLRAFQRAQGELVITWLRERLESRGAAS